MGTTDFADCKYIIQVKILGGLIEVRCKHKECLDGIMDFFSTSISYNFAVPDIIIYCDWEQSDRYLYRTSPLDYRGPILEGVFYQLPGDRQVEQWDSYDPPLPPFVKEPFANMFVGLHAAAVKDRQNNAILFIGPKGSGKTTSALQIVNNSDSYELLTDETVFLRRRSLLVEPFPRLVLPRTAIDGEVTKFAMTAREAFRQVARQSAMINHGFFLKRVSGHIGISGISSDEAYRNIVEHYQYAGSSFKESMITLSVVAREVAFSRISYSNYEQLLAILKSVPEYLNNRRIMKITN
ncbi:hypothetical protein B7C51_23980 [Paenibacillus larvae subsp. pulvifaciens]|uniref:Uncharacterized protein n=3 Tax=Paenibacillus larvae TaxID=1464 RepID=A0A1V0UYF2_9BACL|nr:ATP-binding protein [Paenibacillus larvae]ARF70244.1 hypothetical protein B7C51_23980 [Paenibacillus larvae subsp. pulvifaciens]QHZ51792.1 hypothetical protein ERICV_02670 [Paenibacillus larvae subsp. larvae]